MRQGKKIIVVIPARGGSKGLPGKNIRPLAGTPLIGHAVQVANDSQYTDKVIVSTDSQEIAAVGRKYGADISLRPANLATDTALISTALRDLLKKQAEDYEYLFLLEPTSPFRTPSLLDLCISEIIDGDFDSIATFSPSDPPPNRLWVIENASAKPLLAEADPWAPRQAQIKAYALNGLIYGINISQWQKSESKGLFFGKNKAMITDGFAIDIDTIDDFNLAEYYFKDIK